MDLPNEGQDNIVFKLIVLGQSGVGKSNLLCRYAKGKFIMNNSPTIGIEFLTKTIKICQNNVNLQIWDTAGQERYRSLSKQYYQETAGAILVFSLGDRESFLALPKWTEEIRQHMQVMPVILLVGNKSDLKARFVNVQEANEFAKQHNMAYFETSAALNINIETVFQTLATKVYQLSQQSCNSLKSGKKSILLGNNKKSKQKCC